MIDTDRAPTCGAALAASKAEGRCPRDTEHRQVGHLDAIVEADHAKPKELIRPMRGLETSETDHATIRGFEVMQALKKDQAAPWQHQDGIAGEMRLVERALGRGPSGPHEAVACFTEHLAQQTA